MVVLEELAEGILGAQHALIDGVKHPHGTVDAVQGALEVMLLCHVLRDAVRVLVGHPSSVD